MPSDWNRSKATALAAVLLLHAALLYWLLGLRLSLPAALVESRANEWLLPAQEPERPPPMPAPVIDLPVPEMQAPALSQPR